MNSMNGTSIGSVNSQKKIRFDQETNQAGQCINICMYKILFGLK